MTPDDQRNGRAFDVLSGITIAHSSDLHLGGRTRKGAELWPLRAVLDASIAGEAQLLILAGDIFDSNRVPEALIDAAGVMLADAPIPIVILPGNHDPATADTVYRRTGMTEIPHVRVPGVNADQSITYRELDLDIWGAPHLSYADMTPLESVPARASRWHIVVAHGHWVRGQYDEHRSWLLHDHELTATAADYVALGHWDVPQPAGDGTVAAYYSGSPEVAKSINIVRLSTEGTDVSRQPLVIEP